jgi:hypothetical protein
VRETERQRDRETERDRERDRERETVPQDASGAGRHVFIFEQKYADFFPPPAFDD